MSQISNKGSVDYTKGKIYIYIFLKNNVNNKVYVGSTCWEIQKRFAEHQRCTTKTRESNYKLYVAMKDIGIDQFFWEEVEKFPCANKSQLTARESHWIRHFRSWEDEYGYNRKIEQRTKSEYYQDKKDEMIQKTKAYYTENRDKAREFYNECKVCSCGGTYTVANKARHERSTKHKQSIAKS